MEVRTPRREEIRWHHKGLAMLPRAGSSTSKFDGNCNLGTRMKATTSNIRQRRSLISPGCPGILPVYVCVCVDALYLLYTAIRLIPHREKYIVPKARLRTESLGDSRGKRSLSTSFTQQSPDMKIS